MTFSKSSCLLISEDYTPVVPLFASPKLSEKVLRKGGNCPEKLEIFAKISNALFPFFQKHFCLENLKCLEMRPVAMRPTFIKNAHAYLCNLRNYKFLSKFLESDSQGIWSKFL